MEFKSFEITNANLVEEAKDRILEKIAKRDTNPQDIILLAESYRLLCPDVKAS